MKRLAQVAAVLAIAVVACGRASADSFIDPTIYPQEQVTGVAQQFRSTMTCVSVSVSSAAPATVIATTASRSRSASVQNRSLYNLFCSENSGVKSQTGTTLDALVGWQITAGASASFMLYPGGGFYCINDSQSAATLATVCVGR